MVTCLGSDFVDEIRMIAVGSVLHAHSAVNPKLSVPTMTFLKVVLAGS